MSEMKAFEELMAQSTRRPFRLSSDAGHPANIRITSTQRRHVAKVYAESLERDIVCEANARLLTLAANNVGRLVARLAYSTEILEGGLESEGEHEPEWSKLDRQICAENRALLAEIEQAAEGEQPSPALRQALAGHELQTELARRVMEEEEK